MPCWRRSASSSSARSRAIADASPELPAMSSWLRRRATSVCDCWSACRTVWTWSWNCVRRWFISVVQLGVALDARAVDERAVPAAQILDDERVPAAHDGGVAGRHVEIALGIEPDVRQGVAAKADVGLHKGFGLSDPSPRQKLEL